MRFSEQATQCLSPLVHEALSQRLLAQASAIPPTNPITCSLGALPGQIRGVARLDAEMLVSPIR